MALICHYSMYLEKSTIAPFMAYCWLSEICISQNSAITGAKENRWRTWVNPTSAFWKRQRKQKEARKIIADSNYNTFYLWAKGQLTWNRICRTNLLEFSGGLPFLSGDSCKPAAHSIPIRHRVLSGNADIYRNSSCSFSCTPALQRDSQTPIPDDKNWIKT